MIDFDEDSELTTYVINLDWRVCYIPWAEQTAAGAEYMSRLDGSYDESYMKLGVM